MDSEIGRWCEREGDVGRGKGSKGANREIICRNYSQDANMAAMFVMSGVAKLGITSAQKVNAKNGIVSN